MVPCQSRPATGHYRSEREKVRLRRLSGTPRRPAGAASMAARTARCRLTSALYSRSLSSICAIGELFPNAPQGGIARRDLSP